MICHNLFIALAFAASVFRLTYLFTYLLIPVVRWTDVFFRQKLGVVSDYLTTVDRTSSDGGADGDSPKIVRESGEDAERRSDYRSCGSNSFKMSSSSAPSTSSSDDDDDNDDDDDDDDMDLIF